MAGPRHPFTSTFLPLFLVDAAAGLVTGAAYLSGRSLFDPDRLGFLLNPFSIALLLGAMVQVTLSFALRMRWSARLIGMYVMGYWLVPNLVLLVVALAPIAREGAEAISREPKPLSDPVLGWLSIGISAAQLVLGLWAAHDLRQGHYLPES